MERSTAYRVAWALVVVVAAILAVRLLSSTFLAHDDGITMLGITCNQGRYEVGTPTQQWVGAQVWQDYWQLKTPGCFGQIRSDMADFDIHPPLYFWLLHVWVMVFGVSIPSALMLNFVLVAATGATIAATCRLLSVRNSVTFAVVLTWALTMSTRAASAAVRPYALLGLCAALLLLLTVLWYLRRRTVYLLAMAPVVAAGMLTQFLFLMPAAAVFLIVGVPLLTGRRYRELAQICAVYAAAAGVFLAASPGFMSSVHRGGEQAQPFSFAALPVRIAGVFAALIETFLPLDPAYQVDISSAVGWALTAIVMIPILVITGRWLWRTRRGLRNIAVNADSVPIILFAVCWLAVVTLFLLCISPQHSMRPVYLYFLTPFLFVGLAVAARRSATVIGVISTLFVYQLVGVTIATAGFVYTQQRGSSLVPGPDSAIVLDSDRRGIVPPALWPVAPGVPTYVATQDQLLERFPDVTPVSQRQLFYVSKVMFGGTYGNTEAKRKRILEQFADRGYSAEHLGVSAAMGGADVYRLTRVKP